MLGLYLTALMETSVFLSLKIFTKHGSANFSRLARMRREEMKGQRKSRKLLCTENIEHFDS